LLSAPLIFYSAEEQNIADHEASILLTDYCFKDSEKIFDELRHNCKKKIEMDSMHNPNDILEVQHEAFLANARTIEYPEVIEVKPSKNIRLRLINGDSATNFFILLGTPSGEAIAVDGHRIKPLTNSRSE
jgi:FtsP/CotA-like multicopper oxidase with cupredoxin domain